MHTKLDELYKQGMEAFDAKDFEKAGRIFQELLAVNPRFADIQNKLGIIYNQTNRLELAAQAFEKALDLNAGYTEASLNLAITYSELGMYEKARQVFERAARFAEPKADKTYRDLRNRSLYQGQARGRAFAAREHVLWSAAPG